MVLHCFSLDGGIDHIVVYLNRFLLNSKILAKPQPILHDLHEVLVILNSLLKLGYL